MKLLIWLGLVKKSDYEKLDNLNNEFINKVNKLQSENRELQEKLTRLPYEFDKLVEKYNQGQLNALYYKLINHCRNNKKFTSMLERWDKRRENAIETLKEDKL
jgi:hypothetical protein